MTPNSLPSPKHAPTNVWPAPTGPIVTEDNYEEDMQEAVEAVNRKAGALVTALLVSGLTVFLVNQSVEDATLDIYLVNIAVNLGIVLAINTAIRLVTSRRGRGSS